MKKLYACVHGHFYQPPRENPWLEAVEPEPSAAPYHDWNARIAAECYGPNGAGPVDNYRLMSFNFGPTLLTWLERKEPALYRRILEADQASSAERGGHGNAVAQPYVHAILPLMPWREKLTLIRWGLIDFSGRFGRAPEGMWLPETGVDSETLEALISERVRFTVLAPWQAQGKVGLNRPYRWRSRRFPGKSIALFFFDPDLHKAVNDGLVGAKPLVDDFRARYGKNPVELVHVANDGEFYGHHHRSAHRDLNAALRRLREEHGVRLTNYAEFLALHPPSTEIEIVENTAWSCRHGLGRWTVDCGCRTEARAHWHQGWRAPLRAALNWLGEKLDDRYAREAGRLVKDPWALRDAYAERLLRRESGAAFLKRRAPAVPKKHGEALLTLLEMQRHRLFMHTSCAWFFDDVSGLEPVDALKHAARGIALAERFAPSLAAEFRRLLSHAPSNVKQFGDASEVYVKLALAAEVSPRRAAAHFAIRALLEGPDSPSGDYCFVVERRELGRASRAGGDFAFYAALLTVEDRRTSEKYSALAFAHRQGRLDVACWVLDATRRKPVEELVQAFGKRGRDAEFREELTARLGPDFLTLDALFPDERQAAMRALAKKPKPSRTVVSGAS